jgi:hypothetical protein
VITAVTFLGNDASEARFAQAFPPGTALATIRLKGGTDVYDDLAQQPFTTFMSQHAPWWAPGDPLVLLSFSAGTWALRRYLLDPTTRELTDAVVVMDGLYGGVPCNLEPFEGIVEYARLANSRPSSKRLIVTYSNATPAPGECARTLQETVGGPGVFVADRHATSHGQQLTEVGPDAVAEWITPWINRSSTPRRRGSGALVVGLLAVLGYGIYRWRRAS